MLSNSRLILVAIVAIGIVLSPSATAWYGECGDVDCSGGTDIDDVVYLINYIFVSGPAPCDPDNNDLYDCGVCPIGTVTDIDGNLYYTVKIGDQWWMLENLRVTHYRNGDPIPHVTDGVEWEGLSTGAYCDYDNNPANVATYGRLYNWYAVDDARNIAPAGWHVPSDAEYQTLENYLGGFSIAGGKMKETGTTHWDPPNTGATNESGFSVLPGGYRSLSGPFTGMGGCATFWSSTEFGCFHAWGLSLHYSSSQVNRFFTSAHYGHSVRCVRD